jgi:hypothetical protein
MWAEVLVFSAEMAGFVWQTFGLCHEQHEKSTPVQVFFSFAGKLHPARVDQDTAV